MVQIHYCLCALLGTVASTVIPPRLLSSNKKTRYLPLLLSFLQVDLFAVIAIETDLCPSYASAANALPPSCTATISMDCHLAILPPIDGKVLCRSALNCALLRSRPLTFLYKTEKCLERNAHTQRVTAIVPA